MHSSKYSASESSGLLLRALDNRKYSEYCDLEAYRILQSPLLALPFSREIIARSGRVLGSG